jgi:hypothetical protein
MKTSMNLKGSVTTRRGMYFWSVKDANGNTMASGEEYQIRHAFQNAYDTVSAVRAWIMFGRGDLVVKTKFLECDFKPRNRLGSI